MGSTAHRITIPLAKSSWDSPGQLRRPNSTMQKTLRTPHPRNGKQYPSVIVRAFSDLGKDWIEYERCVVADL